MLIHLGDAWCPLPLRTISSTYIIKLMHPALE